MPVSKRNKTVHMSKVRKKGKESKNTLIEKIKENANKFTYVYLLKMERIKNANFKQIRELLKPGRIFYGKNKVMQLALGTEPSTEIQRNLHLLSQKLKGEKGLLFTSSPPEEITKILESVQPEEFAISGTPASETVVLEEGTESVARFPHYMEPLLRKLGLPSLLQKGKIVLLGDYTVCSEGEILSTEQAHLVKLLGIKMAKFQVTPEAVWHENSVKTLVGETEGMEEI